MALSRTTSPEGHDAMSSSDLSQPDTEPLPFDEEEEDQDGDGRQESQVDGDGDGDQEMVDGENGDQQHNPQSQADAEMESESELDNQNGSNNPIESNQSSPLKATTAFTQDEFSGSDLTDPNDDEDDDEDEDDEEDSEDDQAEKSRGRSKGKWNKANRREREEEEEEEGEDGDGLQDQSPEDPMESTTRNNSEDQEGVEGGEEDDDEEEDRNSNSSRDSSNYDSEDPTSINSNRLRRATRSRAPINSNRGKKNGAAAGTRKSKPRRSSGRSSGDGGGGASNIPSGAVPVTLTNPNNKSSSSSTTNTTTGTRGRGRGRGRGSRGRGRGANSSSRGGAAASSTREGTAATDTQQETDLETNAEDENEAEDPNVEGGGSGKRRRVSSEDEAEGLDGLAALATTTTASNNNNGSNGKIKGRSSRGMSGGMGMLANAPQISIVGGDEEEEEQAEDFLSASARTSREVSMNPDALLEDLQVEAEARENEEGVRKLKGQKTNDQDSSRKDPSSSLNVIDPSIANVDGTSSAIGGAGVSTSATATGAGTGIGEVEETGGLMADSDLAAQHRQEALEQLTKIEIMFAKLRDRLYIERMEELRKEAEMVLEGTHPDLIKLTNIIENQRDNRLKLVEAWLEKEEICVEEIAKADEESSWSSWRNDAVELRRTMMDETARKKRRLDREKRTLDVPRPTRRYQAFEAELTPNPRFDPSTRINENPTTSSSSRQATNPTISRKKAGKQRAVQSMEQESEYQMQMELDNDLLAGAGQVRAGEFVAYPGLRGLESNDVWNDLETMGIAPLPAGYSHNLYSTGVDPYSGGATNGYYYEEPQVSNSNPYGPYPSYEANRAPPPRTSNSNINVFGPDHPSHHAFVGNHQPVVPPRTNQDHSMNRDLEREREREMFEKERERERIREKELKRERNRVQQQQQQSTPISSSSSYLTNGNGNQSSRMSNQQMTSSFSSPHPNQLPPPPPPPPTSSLKAGSPTNHLHQHPHSNSAHNGRDLNGQMEMGH